MNMLQSRSSRYSDGLLRCYFLVRKSLSNVFLNTLQYLDNKNKLLVKACSRVSVMVLKKANSGEQVVLMTYKNEY